MVRILLPKFAAYYHLEKLTFELTETNALTHHYESAELEIIQQSSTKLVQFFSNINSKKCSNSFSSNPSEKPYREVIPRVPLKPRKLMGKPKSSTYNV